MNKERLSAGSCFALVAASVCFGVVGASMGALKEEFILSNQQMGRIADDFLHEKLVEQKGETVAALEQAASTYPPLAANAPEPFRSEILGAVENLNGVLTQAQAAGLPAGTANAMRDAISNAPKGDAAEAVVSALKNALNPADNYGGRKSFRCVVPFSLVIIIVFGVLYLRDRAAGGYRAEALTARQQDPPDAEQPT